MFRWRQGIPGCDRVQEMPRTGYCWFWVTTEFFPGSVSRQEFLCSDMVLRFKAIKLLQHGFLCCDRGSSSLS